MNLFVCSGLCISCDEQKCPYRYDESFQQQLEDNHIMDLIKNELINPESLIEIMEEEGKNLFNIISAWHFNEKRLTKREITKCIILWLPANIYDDMSQDIYEAFLKSVSVIVEKIAHILSQECVPGECFSCIMREHCPNVQANSFKV